MQFQNYKIIIIALVVGLASGMIGGMVVNIPLMQLQSGSGTVGQLNWPLKNRTVDFNKSATVNVEEESQSINVVEKSAPAVVSIIISKELQQFSGRNGANVFPFDDFFNFGFPFEFYQPRQQTQPKDESGSKKQEIGGGTGFFVSSDGLILTNRHVVEDTEADYTVITNTGKKYNAKVLAKDSINDLAVVKIEAKDMPIIPLGNSDSIKIGQTVIAIGNVLGQYRNTVTKGVISGIGRRVVAGDNMGSSEVIDEAIQTDAAINPGNSGGPLINLAGEVIGINTAVNREGQAVGFAISINVAKKVIESVKKNGRIVRPWLGVRYVMLNDQIAKENQLSVKEGALIIRGDNRAQLAVVPGSPADKAGLVENDIIIKVDNTEVTQENPLAKIIAQHNPGDTLSLVVLHKGNKTTIKVKLEEMKELFK